MKEKLTHRQALELCKILWESILEDPLLDKYLHVKALQRKGITDLVNIKNDCFACEYYKQQSGVSPSYPDYICRHSCILKNLWPEGCMHTTSCYYSYENSTTEQTDEKLTEIATNCARQIISACDKELANLKD